MIPKTAPHTLLKIVKPHYLMLFLTRRVMEPSGDIDTPLAPAQRWNAHAVSVQCPFCTKIHTHNFGDGYSSIFCALHCNCHSLLSLLSNRFAYPLSTPEGTLAYKIDKNIGYFVAFRAKA
jgi:hypothetical protein